MNIAIYARYSSDKQSETSIEQQLKVCRDYCERNAYTVITEYADEAISGRTDERPEFQKMILDAKRKLFKAIVIYSVDRFSRTLSQSSKYAEELEKYNVMLISATEAISGGNPSAKMLLNMLMVQAQYYSDELAQKIGRGMDYNAERGFSLGGVPALGYKAVLVDESKEKGKKKFVVDEQTAPTVKRIFEMYADEGMTMAQIIRHLNSQGIKTSIGREFNKNSIRKLLLNKKYIGIFTYRGTEYTGLIARIVDDDLFERAGLALSKNKKAPAKNKAVGEYAYILTLKLYCGHCKEIMSGWSGTSKAKKIHRYYMCNGRKRKICDKRNIRKKRIEDTVINKCREMLTDENIKKITDEVMAHNKLEQKNNVNLKRLEKLIADNEKQHTNLMSTLKLCEDDDIKAIIMNEMSLMVKQSRELHIQLAIEESRKSRITRRDVKFMLEDLQNGDISDIKYRKTLVNVLVDKIYAYDDGRITIVLYNGDTLTEIDTNLIDDIEKEIPTTKENIGYFIGDSPPPNFPVSCPYLGGTRNFLFANYQ
ncbi:MAG: recombinase family protein [Oscillospiraceae bacterium]|nr:recombinase family protein [Oscillospiraceae bacterium]